ncbi:MAG: flagellar biosynthesis protein FlhF [Cellvibrionaceae bacterium]
MQIKRYVAADMRRALQLVKDNLGDDAVILSNRKTDEGVEILATLEYEPQHPDGKKPSFVDQPVLEDSAPLASDFDMEQQRAMVRAAAEQLKNNPAAAAQMQQPQLTPQQQAAQAAEQPYTGLSETAKMRLEQEVENARERMIAARRKEAQENDWAHFEATNKASSASAPVSQQERSFAERFEEQYASSRENGLGRQNHQSGFDQPAAHAAVNTEQNADDEKIQSMYSEIQELRKMLEQKMSAPAAEPEVQVVSTNRYHTSVQKAVMARLSTMGLPEDAAVELVKNIDNRLSVSEAWPQVLADFAQSVDCGTVDPVANGGTFALVGPTGVGKTTTIAKLATRYVLEHGPEEVALVTTDNYRIAAHEQLKAVGRILDIPVRVVDDRRSLPEVLHSLRKRSLVLIDTAGMRQGDPELRGQMAMLRDDVNIKTLLVLNSSSQFQVMRSAVHSYGEANLCGCVISKLDEAVSMGEVLGVVLESNLPVYYTTDGQEVPADLQVARGHQLISRTVKLASGGSRQTSAVNLAAG